MSDREMALKLIRELPENTTLAEIARRIEFVAGIRTAMEEADRGEGVSIERAREMVRQWTFTTR